MSGIRIISTPATREAFRALWLARPLIPRRKIAAAMGVSKHAVTRFAARLGLPPRMRGVCGMRDTLFSAPGSEDLFRKLWLDGVANREILRALGKNNHPSNVSQAAKIRGLARRPRCFRGLTLEEWVLKRGMTEDAARIREAMRATREAGNAAPDEVAA